MQQLRYSHWGDRFKSYLLSWYLCVKINPKNKIMFPDWSAIQNLIDFLRTSTFIESNLKSLQTKSAAFMITNYQLSCRQKQISAEFLWYSFITLHTVLHSCRNLSLSSLWDYYQFCFSCFPSKNHDALLSKIKVI